MEFCTVVAHGGILSIYTLMCLNCRSTYIHIYIYSEHYSGTGSKGNDTCSFLVYL